MKTTTDRLSQAALRRHHIGIKTKGLRFRGALYVFRYNAGHYDVFLNNACVMQLETSNVQAVMDGDLDAFVNGWLRAGGPLKRMQGVKDDEE